MVSEGSSTRACVDARLRDDSGSEVPAPFCVRSPTAAAGGSALTSRLQRGVGSTLGQVETRLHSCLHICPRVRLLNPPLLHLN